MVERTSIKKAIVCKSSMESRKLDHDSDNSQSWKLRVQLYILAKVIKICIFAYFTTLMIVMSMIAATMNFISLTFIGLLIDWFGDNEVLGTRRTPL